MLTHRWMGIVIGVMFVAWVVSGIVLLYYGLPHLTAAERLARLPPLDAAAIRISPAEAATRVDGEPFRMRVSMQGSRPVYRINTGRVFGRWQLVYADTGERFDGFDAGEALDWLRGTVPEAAGTMTYDGYVTGPELFTHSPALQTHMPMHRVALNDPADTVYYVSVNTGEAVMKTDRASRALGVAGYLLHTLFFFRQEPWWSGLLLALSWAALLMCILGVVLGLVRFALTPRFRHRGQMSRSPYTGLMKWHHYAGLIFSIFVLTWAFSGVASLNVLPGIRETLYTPEQIAVGARSVQGEGPRIDFAPLSLEALQAAIAAIEESFPVKELELISFAGAPYYLAYREPTADERLAWRSKSVLDFLTATLDHEHRLVRADDPAARTFDRFSDEAMLDAARRAIPAANVVAVEQLDAYDSYYYDGLASFDLGLPKAAKTLPALRAQFDDEAGTWLYLTPSHGQILKYEALDRANRWGYYGLHGLDFAFLYERRPLWDIVAVALLLGVGVVSVTTLLPMLRRLKRHGIRIVTRLRQRAAPSGLQPERR
jgi:hypothetical protein